MQRFAKGGYQRNNAKPDEPVDNSSVISLIEALLKKMENLEAVDGNAKQQMEVEMKERRK